MRIAFASAEMTPFAKTGGLGDVIGTLPQEISRQGHSVKVFLPFYKAVQKLNLSLRVRVDDLVIQMGLEKYKGRILGLSEGEDVEILLVDFPELFDRDELYGTEKGDYKDNDIRFILFQKSCLEGLKEIDFNPDIIHCHDWHTGLIPAFLKTTYKKDPFFKDTKSVFTIHNLAYQGSFPSKTLELTGIPKTEFTPDRLSYKKELNHMKAGIVYADQVSTVSSRYSEEIKTKEYGCGLEKFLKARKDSLSGIINGIRLEDWDPENDPDLTIPFRPNEWNKKIANKGILQKENKLEVKPSTPVFGIVTRLADQKGIEMLGQIMPKLAKLDMQLILLGTGDNKNQKLMTKMGKRYSSKFGINILFDLKMAKRIYAGSDIFLMPSRYEPCGLGQLIALRYGTVPLVRETGGLADTVVDFDSKTEVGNGIVFKDYKAASLLDAIKRTIKLYKDKDSWRKMVENGMDEDFSWEASAKQYVELYRKVEKKKLVTA